MGVEASIAAPADQAADEAASAQPAASADGVDDCPVEDLDIVEFLKEEQESAVGLSLAESTNANKPGLVCVKEAVYERREPKPDSMIGHGQIVVHQPKARALPAGARQAGKQMGHWAWGNAGGGLEFAKGRQQKR